MRLANRAGLLAIAMAARASSQPAPAPATATAPVQVLDAMTPQARPDELIFRKLTASPQGGSDPAIPIATLDGATYLGRRDTKLGSYSYRAAIGTGHAYGIELIARRIGSVAVGKNAEPVLVRGDPSTRIADIENVEIVFKDGVASPGDAPGVGAGATDSTDLATAA